MGTVLEVTVVAKDQELADALLRGAFDAAKHWDDVLTTWRPEGELAQLNNSKGALFPASKDLLSAISVMRKLSFYTRGAFDPAVGPIVERYRRGEPTPGPREGESLDIYRIQTAAQPLSGGVRLRHGAALDAGGIGKGIALDAIANYFGNRATAFYLDFGGSSQLAKGKNPEGSGEGWKVVITGDSTGTIHGVVLLDGASISTSRSLEANDPAGAIIDPQTLAPVKPHRLATVIAPDAATSEAWSTALVALGPTGVALAESLGLQVFVEVDGKITKSKDFPIVPLN